MTLQQRINLLARLGDYLLSGDDLLKAVMYRTEHNNPWLTVPNCERAATTIAKSFLQKEKLEVWANTYQIKNHSSPKKVGVVMAGNIPLVGFHDLLCVFITGNQSLIKLSDKDKFLVPHLIKKLTEWNLNVEKYFKILPFLKGFDAIIATGSNNSAHYFEQYFSKYPHIIRKNRNAVAVLDGAETTAQLYALGNDVFEYFGLGCRNVSKLYVPKNYQFEPLLEAFHEYRAVILHNKYKNNFDYNYALYMLNKIPYKANGCILLTENEAIASRIASLHYEFYEEGNNLVAHLRKRASKIQCVVSRKKLNGLKTVSFGKAQQPDLADYADGVDTLHFLIAL